MFPHPVNQRLNKLARLVHIQSEGDVIKKKKYLESTYVSPDSAIFISSMILGENKSLFFFPRCWMGLW